jgi:hypothetical protein
MTWWILTATHTAAVAAAVGLAWHDRRQRARRAAARTAHARPAPPSALPAGQPPAAA